MFKRSVPGLGISKHGERRFAGGNECSHDLFLDEVAQGNPDDEPVEAGDSLLFRARVVRHDIDEGDRPIEPSVFRLVFHEQSFVAQEVEHSFVGEALKFGTVKKSRRDEEHGNHSENDEGYGTALGQGFHGV